MFSETIQRAEISIRMLDGAILRGSIALGQGKSLEGALSKDTPFLEFTSKDGQRKYLAKHQVAYVEPVELLRKPVLAPPRDPRFVDPFTILGVASDCDIEQAKDAYRRMAKLYHPDNFADVALPDEVARYLRDMFSQINTAFTEVRSEIQQAG